MPQQAVGTGGVDVSGHVRGEAPQLWPKNSGRCRSSPGRPSCSFVEKHLQIVNLQPQQGKTPRRSDVNTCGRIMRLHCERYVLCSTSDTVGPQNRRLTLERIGYQERILLDLCVRGGRGFLSRSRGLRFSNSSKLGLPTRSALQTCFRPPAFGDAWMELCLLHAA
jgi:hypothetical protein